MLTLEAPLKLPQAHIALLYAAASSWYKSDSLKANCFDNVAQRNSITIHPLHRRLVVQMFELMYVVYVVPSSEPHTNCR